MKRGRGERELTQDSMSSAELSPVSFPGDTGESIFQVRHRESLKKFITVEGGIRTHNPRRTWSVGDAIC